MKLNYIILAMGLITFSIGVFYNNKAEELGGLIVIFFASCFIKLDENKKLLKEINNKINEA